MPNCTRFISRDSGAKECLHDHLTMDVDCSDLGGGATSTALAPHNPRPLLSTTR
jgi:hypothetical protein